MSGAVPGFYPAHTAAVNNARLMTLRGKIGFLTVSKRALPALSGTLMALRRAKDRPSRARVANR